jgi:hypothetical protein
MRGHRFVRDGATRQRRAAYHSSGFEHPAQFNDGNVSLNSMLRLTRSFSMPVGAGITIVDSDSNKSRFRNFRSSCLRGEREAPIRERGLFESLFCS